MRGGSGTEGARKFGTSMRAQGLARIFASGTPFAPACGLRSDFRYNFMGLQSPCREQKACRAGFPAGEMPGHLRWIPTYAAPFARRAKGAPRNRRFRGAPGFRLAESRRGGFVANYWKDCGNPFRPPGKPSQNTCQTAWSALSRMGRGSGPEDCTGGVMRVLDRCSLQRRPPTSSRKRLTRVRYSFPEASKIRA